MRRSSQDFFRVKNIPSSTSLSSWCLALRATDPSGGGSRAAVAAEAKMCDDYRGLNEDTKKPLSASSSSVPCYTYRRLGTVLQAHDGKKGGKVIPAEEKAGKDPGCEDRQRRRSKRDGEGGQGIVRPTDAFAEESADIFSLRHPQTTQRFAALPLLFCVLLRFSHSSLSLVRL